MISRLLKPLAVVGGVALDITGTIQASGSRSRSVLHTSTPGKVKQSLGGVGRNVCEASMRTGVPSFMVSMTGQDLAGATIREGMHLLGMVYNALHTGDGQLVAAVADMDIFDSLESSTAIFFEPTSVPKSLKVFEHEDVLSSGVVNYVSPNQYELEAMVETARRQRPAVNHSKINIGNIVTATMTTPDIVEKVLPMAHYLSQFVPNIVTKLGEYGCLLVSNNKSHVHTQYFPPEIIDPTAIKSVTGAGDCFVGTLLANLLILDKPSPTRWAEMIQQSQKSSILTLQSDLAVSVAISQELLDIFLLVLVFAFTFASVIAVVRVLQDLNPNTKDSN
ncbi:hypothetical protein PHYBLDRAFT_168277 [Phycomyces blakesleeanus NRRL 1555(-)]|uniref:Carbohydrate kinase PfkB domain-containing protein n=1 Tax=Phycomyces blakesleeanus (strain ATCC 8743b / DSM 1359 / FGSC 10004 / NBRC 33097 / NRRL 1555) TaxID=763407 RepID=A0A167MT03_PHYB8|nr:hypothetical protein PHYBLDRAFT_168277 [Phycomyces blakesleeanus NRRL 1555(-)]OAD73849.1 hypothetical protein PHYBLDRAFT_168277 [Phycomyces blakesleeanus NRRL 1555(-)]|eukprot:XP_018291889.1 hypothetical protein PHYBLDRAFT_168277 [Phycomyces blakesleeanus NRRL 1555(-)]